MDSKIEPNVILGEFILGNNDPQHPQSLDKSLDSQTKILPNVAELRKSAEYYLTPVYVLTNGNSINVSKFLEVVHTEIDVKKYDLSIYFIRWELALNFLIAHPEIEKIALVDVTDVRMLNYPYDLIEEEKLYFGDEFKDISTGIVANDQKPDYIADFFDENPRLQLLNPGVIVGTRSIIIEFLTIFVEAFTNAQVRSIENVPKSSFGQYEMALVNYVAYRYFDDRLER